MFGRDVLKLHVNVCVVVGGAVGFKESGVACVECSLLFFVVAVFMYEGSPSVTAPVAGAALPATFGGRSSHFLLAPLLLLAAPVACSGFGS